MTTKKSTHLVVTAKSSGGDNPIKKQLEMRAARFGISGFSRSSARPSRALKSATTPKPSNPAEAEKFAARAARFADLKAPTGNGKTASTKAIVGAGSGSASISTGFTPDVEKLAKRAARFADVQSTSAASIKTTTATTTATSTTSVSGQTATNASEDGDILAKRAARFAAGSGAAK